MWKLWRILPTLVLLVVAYHPAASGPGYCGGWQTYLPLVAEGSEMAEPASQLRTHQIVEILKTIGRVAGARSPFTLFPDTAADDFAGYGGDQLAQNASAALYWLLIDSFETFAVGSWQKDSGTGTVSVVTSPIKEGSYGLKIFPGAGASVVAGLVYSPAKNFSADGRFTASDYVVFSAYLNTLGATEVSSVKFLTDATNYYYLINPGIGDSAFGLVAGWNLIYKKRSDFAVVGSPNWNSIAGLQITAFDAASTGTSYVVFDNLQVIKAFALDATLPDATGGLWRFEDADGDSSHWTILQDMPGFAYALAQLKTDATKTYIAVYNGLAFYAVTDHMAAAVCAREDGKLGIGFALAGHTVDASGNNGYFLVLNTTANTLTLYQRDAGVDTSLGSVSYTANPNVVYYLGLKRTGTARTTIQGYISTNPGDVFAGNNLKMSVTNTAFSGGEIGVISYGVNARFARVRAGSPAHADTAEWAANAGQASSPSDDFFDSVLLDSGGNVLLEDDGKILLDG